MEILGRKGLSGVVKLLLDLIFIGGIGILISLPITVKWYWRDILGLSDNNYIILFAFLVVSGIFALIIVNEMKKIFISLNDKNPFVMSTVKSLNRMAISSFMIAAVYLIKIIILNSFFTMIIMMVFVMAGFFSMILAEVFRQAVVVKEENDLTI